MSKAVLKHIGWFTRKHLCRSLFVNKVSDCRPTTLLKIGSDTIAFTVPTQLNNFVEHLSAVASTLKWVPAWQKIQIMSHRVVDLESITLYNCLILLLLLFLLRRNIFSEYLSGNSEQNKFLQTIETANTIQLFLVIT